MGKALTTTFEDFADEGIGLGGLLVPKPGQTDRPKNGAMLRL